MRQKQISFVKEDQSGEELMNRLQSLQPVASATLSKCKHSVVIIKLITLVNKEFPKSRLSTNVNRRQINKLLTIGNPNQNLTEIRSEELEAEVQKRILDYISTTNMQQAKNQKQANTPSRTKIEDHQRSQSPND